MKVDQEARDLARQAAGHLRAAMDQLDAAYQDLVRHGYIEPMEQRQRCPECGGSGWYGERNADPQLDTLDECPECEGQGFVPPLQEPERSDD